MESFRNEDGQPRQRTVATLGRIDEQGGQLDALLGGLLRAKGHSAGASAAPQVRFESALALGDVWALDALWYELGFDRLDAIFRRARFTTAVEQAIRVMVFNRLCDAQSKLGVLRWLGSVSMPGIDTAQITHQQLLRSMDALMDHQEAVDGCIAQLLRPLIDEDLSVVFYDLTTIRAEGLSQQEGDVRHFGMSKEGVVGWPRRLLARACAPWMRTPLHNRLIWRTQRPSCCAARLCVNSWASTRLMTDSRSASFSLNIALPCPVSDRLLQHRRGHLYLGQRGHYYLGLTCKRLLRCSPVESPLPLFPSLWIATMNRCPPLFFLRRTALCFALAAVSGTCASTALAQGITPNTLSGQRNFPDAALRGTLVITSATTAEINGQGLRMAPGMRLINTQNGLEALHSAIGKKYTVNYQIEQSTGLLLAAWILTPAEAATARAGGNASSTIYNFKTGNSAQ